MEWKYRQLPLHCDSGFAIAHRRDLKARTSIMGDVAIVALTTGASFDTTDVVVT